jgi:hypothetical protein
MILWLNMRHLFSSPLSLLRLIVTDKAEITFQGRCPTISKSAAWMSHLKSISFYQRVRALTFICNVDSSKCSGLRLPRLSMTQLHRWTGPFIRLLLCDEQCQSKLATQHLTGLARKGKPR